MKELLPNMRWLAFLGIIVLTALPLFASEEEGSAIVIVLRGTLVCQDGKYSLLTDSEPVKFDRMSNSKIARFLKRQGSTVNVVVNIMKFGDEFSLLTITNEN
jgi:hypothetical protein